jgi:hypothetical protein
LRLNLINNGDEISERMITMKKTVIYSGIFVVFLFIIFSIYHYNSLSPSFISDDIHIEGSIKSYDENSFLVELDIERNSNGAENNIVYPISKGLGNISFIANEGLYAPGVLGTWYETEEILRNKVDKEFSRDILGFSIPDQQGKHKLKFTMKKLDDFKELTELTVYYIHVEKRFGKDLSWVKNISLKPNM